MFKVFFARIKQCFTVYDVKHDGFYEDVRFLIYNDGQWEYWSANEFVPVEE